MNPPAPMPRSPVSQLKPRRSCGVKTANRFFASPGKRRPLPSRLRYTSAASSPGASGHKCSLKDPARRGRGRSRRRLDLLPLLAFCRRAPGCREGGDQRRGLGRAPGRLGPGGPCDAAWHPDPPRERSTGAAIHLNRPGPLSFPAPRQGGKWTELRLSRPPVSAAPSGLLVPTAAPTSRARYQPATRHERSRTALFLGQS